VNEELACFAFGGHLMAAKRIRALRPIREVLRYTHKKVGQQTVLRAFLRWREENHLPKSRCDNPECTFFEREPRWNNAPLKLILDHRNGVNSDNRPENLRLLCPNCDSQLPTRGGANKGRVEKAPGGFALKGKQGRKDYVLPAETGRYTLSG